MSEIAISVNNISKMYKLYENPMDRLKESLGLTRKKRYKNMKTYYKAHTQKDNGLAGCMECGQCENICPQKISIRKYFGEIKQLFE